MTVSEAPADWRDDFVRNTVRDMLHVVFRHKGKIIAGFCGILFLVTAYTYLAAEIYQSESKLLVRLGRESLAVDPTVTGPMVGVMQNRENEVKSELAILKSRYIAEQVVQAMGEARFLDRPDEAPVAEEMKGTGQEELRTVRREVRSAEAEGDGLLVRLDLAAPLTAHERAVKKVMKSLKVEVEAKTNIISATFEAQSPELAHAALDRIIGFYLERHVEVNAAQASPKFFEVQAQKLLEELNRCETALIEFRAANGIASVELEKAALVGRVSEIQTQLNAATSEAEAGRARVAALAQALAGRSNTQVLERTTGITNFAADDLKDKLAELRLKESDLAARYADQYRPLVEVREQIRVVEEALKREEETRTSVKTGPDENFQKQQLALETERAHVRAREAEIRELLRQKSDLSRLAELQAEYDGLSRQKDLAEKEYLEYRDNLQRANISAALDRDKVSNVSVVQPATLPMEPIRPKKLLNIFFGCLLGLCGGLAFAFAMEYLDDKLNTAEDVERRLHLPVLTSISEEEFRAGI